MRTTIELKDEHRAALLKIAAERGERGFSGLIEEAVEKYLRELDDADRQRRLAAFDRAVGSLTPEFADHLEETIRDLRSRWRTPS